MTKAKQNFIFNSNMCKKISFVLLSAFLLTSCSNKRDTGTISGAAIGGVATAVITRNPLMSVVGAVAGGYIGNSIGQKLDERDRQRHERAFDEALNSRQDSSVSNWQSRRSGNKGFIQAGERYRDDYGQQCREFRQKVIIGGKVEEAYGTACLQRDDSWRVVSR